MNLIKYKTRFNEHKPPIHKFYKAMIIQVAKIGNNINQIAKHVNIDKVIDGVF